jgi:simple sugar transport system permease protein
MRDSLKGFATRLARIMAQPLLAVAVGFAIGAAVIMVAGESPLRTYAQMFEKSFFSAHYLMQTLTRAVPVAVCAVAIITAWRAGHINLGVEGQMIAGSFVGTAVAIHSPFPAPVTFVLAAVCGMAAGALLALFSAFIYERFNVSIVISTLMMNYIADNVSLYFITFPLRDPASKLAIQTAEIPEALRLPRLIEGNTMNLGFLLTLALVALFAFVNSKTSFGYESKMTGLNPVFARYGGIRQSGVMYAAMALSGALAAAAGMLEIFGVKYRFAEAMFTSTGYAWTGLMSALISSLHPVGAFFTSVFLSGLQVGGQAIQRTLRIPLQVATVIQASITLFVSIRLLIKFKSPKKRQVKPDGR